MVQLFEIDSGKVVPSTHCYTLYFLKDIMDEFPEDYLKIYQYLFYMTCPNPDLNPFFHLIESEKEDLIIQEIQAEFSIEEPTIIKALEICTRLYETETSRSYDAIKTSLDRMTSYLKKTVITDGRDGNIMQIKSLMKEFDDIRQSYKGVFKDLQDEQRTTIRGGKDLAYDG